jgi:hypothetical protein
LNSPEKRRQWIEAIHEQNLERDRLFQLIAALANCLDRDVVVAIMRSHLGVEPVENGDCTTFDDIAVRFNRDGRVTSICHIIDGSADDAGSTTRDS